MPRPDGAPLRRRPLSRAAAVVVAFALVLTGVAAGSGAAAEELGATSAAASARTATDASAVPAGVSTTIVPAANTQAFNPGNIISDAVFFNTTTMSEAQIQAFLQARVPACQSGYTCLKDWYDTSRTVSADAMCGAYSGGVRERASRIIYKVAKSCGINPQVILATLQKEQGLVTHTWPSTWRYTIAMGQGCPDTAACDTRYYGFFNQVYGAARQFKRYANPAGTSQYFTWYTPGNTSNVLYNPNRDCGSSPVRIANQATANLYYYTPYQPNRAALNAGTGTGDGCSSYGNRNFYNYFSDWFGSTQRTPPPMLKANGAVYFVSGSSRFHILPSTLPEYQRVYGAPLSVSPEYAALFDDGGTASLFIRNASTGEVSLLQGGQKHWFGSCSLVAAWGGGCATLTQMTSLLYDRSPVGARMTSFARSTEGGQILKIWGSQLRPILDAPSAALVNGGEVPYAAVMSGAARSSYTAGPYMFAPLRAIRVDGAADAYLPTSDYRLLKIPSWALAVDYGIPAGTFRVVSAADLSGYTKDGVMSMTARCGATDGIPGSGVFAEVAAGALPSSTATVLDPFTCAVIPHRAAPASGQVFIGAAGQSPIYHLAGGALRYVATSGLLRDLNAGTPPVTIRVAAASLARIPRGLGYPTPGSVVRAEGATSVYLVSGASLVSLPSWETAKAYGLRTTSTVVSPAVIASAGKPVGRLGHFVQCGAVLYAAGSGSISRVVSGSAAGSPVTTLSGSTCDSLRKGGDIAQAVMVSDGLTTAVAAGAGFLRLATAAQAKEANNGVTPNPRIVSSAYLAALPQPTALPVDGDLVRAANGTAVYLVDGGKRIAMSNWGIGDDLGISKRLTVRPAAETAAYAIRAGGLSDIVRCGADAYVGSGGSLVRVDPVALPGIQPTVLSAATCSTLTLGTASALTAFYLADAAGNRYSIVDGHLQAVESVTAEVADDATAILTVSTGTLTSLGLVP